jgi:hypothetical protein
MSSELPGMWEEADLMGGATDADKPSEATGMTWGDKGCQRRPDSRCKHAPDDGCHWCCICCNTDTHWCPGCGTITGHKEKVCVDCSKMHGLKGPESPTA